MPHRAERRVASPRRRPIVALGLGLGMLVGLAGAAQADCPRPRITGFTTTGFACIERCGNVAVLFSSNTACDHFNIRERGGLQFEHKPVRGHRPTARLAPFPRNLPVNSTIHVSIQGCTRNLVGQSSCSAWSSEASFYIPDTSPKGKACETYAQRAIGTLKLARDTYKCDAKAIAGSRWSPDIAHHRNWCLGADAKSIDFETRERARIAQECRVEAAKGLGGRPRITVFSRRGDIFIVSGEGFVPSAPVVIRLSGPGAAVSAVTIFNDKRILADRRGTINVRLFGARICNRGSGGEIVFVAQHQDGTPSPPVKSKCA